MLQTVKAIQWKSLIFFSTNGARKIGRSMYTKNELWPKPYFLYKLNSKGADLKVKYVKL